MTDSWTVHDDAILEAWSRAKQVSEMATWPTEQLEHVDSEGTIIELHDQGNHGAGVSWGFCAEVVSTPDNPEVVMRASIGDRVRAGHGLELDKVIAEVNREMAAAGHSVELNVPPFRYARDTDKVFLEARFCPDELTENDKFWLAREFESTMMNVPDLLFEPHMEVVHWEGDDDCCCDACRAVYEANRSPEDIERERAEQERDRELGLDRF